MLKATQLKISKLDVPLLAPFGIATGTQHIAHNVLVRLETNHDIVGFGEATPVEHISGETQADVLSSLNHVFPVLKDINLLNYRRVCATLREVLGHVPSALAAVEIAVFDALAKYQGQSLLQLFGASTHQLLTDITITTGTLDESKHAAKRYEALGFSTLKVKIGGAPIADDLSRLAAIAQAAPTAQLVLDGNTAFSVAEAVDLIAGLGPLAKRVTLFEQPVERDNFEGLAEVELKSGVAVAADESLRSEDDFRRILAVGGISAINIKTAKLGLLQAWDLLVAARRAGLAIMVGGMVETELSMTASACLAAGVGGVAFVDLDTPLLLGPRPLQGGFRQQGPLLDLSVIERGHGVTPLAEE